MGADDLARLEEAAEDKRLALIPGTPLSRREREALPVLVRHGVGVLIPLTKAQGCGPSTAERLQARGFLEINRKSADRISGYTLTAAGLAAWQEMTKQA